MPLICVPRETDVTRSYHICGCSAWNWSRLLPFYCEHVNSWSVWNL